MTDPRRPRSNEAQLPDPLDQIPARGTPENAEEHGSEDARLLAEAPDGAREGDVERVD